MTDREVVYAAIDSERDYQERRWNLHHEVAAFILFMEEYLGFARNVISTKGDPQASDEALHQIRKVAGLAVACMEQHGAPLRLE